MKVIVHGGAGGPPEAPTRRQASLTAAARTATKANTPFSAVLDAVTALEADPRFNAGVGSAVQSDGRIRTDAGIMTDSGSAGAACAMLRVEHAIEVAAVVARETPHVLLAGESAVDLARAFGIDTDCDLWTDASRERWTETAPPESDSVADHLRWVTDRFGGSDTVGAVATDGQTLVAGTSTGGRWCALAGRVGDVPQVGAGFHTTETAAASATGAGEAIARFGLARRGTALVERGLPAQLAADRAIREFDEETGEQAGVILLDIDGRTGHSHCSPAMQTATWQRS